MHNVFLIAKREYLERVRTKAFLLSTILIPVLMGGGLFISVYSATRAKTASHITIVSQDTQLAEDLRKQLETGKDSKMKVEVVSPPTTDTRDALVSETDDKQIDGFLWIDSPAGQGDKPKFTYYSRSAADIATTETLTAAVRQVLMREKLSHQGMVPGEIESLMRPTDIQTQRVANGRATASDTGASFFGVYLLFFLMYMTVMIYGMNVSRSIIEEKTSRVFEVLLATIRPEEMMAGKIIGVGSVGLTQVAIWLTTAVALTSSSLMASMTGAKGSLSLSPMQIGFFLVFFILGFLLYSSIGATLGAMVNSEQELQQLNLFMALPLAACFFALGTVVTSPGSAASTAISLIPFCTPLIMYLRISLQMPPWWQIALSIVDMMVFIYGTMWFASRVYRVGILMYGKRPTLPEILRWVKYS